MHVCKFYVRNSLPQSLLLGKVKYDVRKRNETRELGTCAGGSDSMGTGASTLDWILDPTSWRCSPGGGGAFHAVSTKRQG